MPTGTPSNVRALLLQRRGLIFVDSTATKAEVTEDHLRALDIELADLGRVVSTRLRARLARATLDELSALRLWARATLLAGTGADLKHEPLFRSFPHGIPDDTLALWWSKVLVHFLQTEGAPCLFCRRTGTTHVLNPCQHVVCDQCFDGASYSACPVCERAVDPKSPFFQPSVPKAKPNERFALVMLDLGDDIKKEAQTLFVALCQRKQVLSPNDLLALSTLLTEYRLDVIPWLPAKIPVRENVAHVFGALFRSCPPDEVLPHARPHLKTATDVLRFIAVSSGAGADLIAGPRWVKIDTKDSKRFSGQVRRNPYLPDHVCLNVKRFRVVRMSRALRRTLLSLLDGLAPDRLVEDMLRHHSYWVWVGNFLHPHEYAKRFPNVAQAFASVRKHAPDGTPAPKIPIWGSRVGHALATNSLTSLLGVLGERPGEFARRLDHTMRLASRVEGGTELVAATTAGHLPRFATPVLLTLLAHLPKRTQHCKQRVYFPKSQVGLGVSAPDQRTLLSSHQVETLVPLIEGELLRRFAAKAPFAEAVIDRALENVLVPFNERTASTSAISLPRGSRVAVPDSKLLRLFLHWCQPKGSGGHTDLDLSVAFYDDAWALAGTCSYYHLKLQGARRGVIAVSGGDRQDAPFPDGASELVDIHRDMALAEGYRYAVMVVNAYSGLSFSALERGFAGVMLRDDAEGDHFDPRTVKLKFALAGDNGIFAPLVFDLRESVVHWLDVYSKGEFQMNNVANSNRALEKICPALMGYFSSGVRASMFQLACLHAAARARRVFIRGDAIEEYVRGDDESIAAFLERIKQRSANEPRSRIPATPVPRMLTLYQGDLDAPEKSESYVLFRERTLPNLSAADLLS